MGQQNPLAVTLGRKAGGSTQEQATFGKQGDFYSSPLHGTKYLSNYSSNLFAGANQTAVTTSAGLATTYTGIVLFNPATNPNIMAVRRVSGLLVVAPAALTGFGLIVGWAAGGITVSSSTITPFVSNLSNLGGPSQITPTAKLAAAATLVGTPTWGQWVGLTPSTTGVTQFSVDIEGGIILAPGGYAAIGTTIAGPATGFFGSIEWEEFPQ